MKKNYLFGFLVSFLLAFVLTGCGIYSKEKILTCTKEETDDDGYKIVDTMEVTYNKSRVLKLKATNITETDPDYIDFSFEFGQAFAEKFNQIKGIKMEYQKIDNNKLQLVMDVNYNELELEQMKELFGDAYDENSEKNLYRSKDFTIDEFKEENLEGYTCK